MNKCVMMGRISQMPELKVTQSGKEVLEFSIAIPRKYDRETVDFVNAVAWAKTAVFIHTYFKKGDMIAVEGQMECDKYQAPDGTNRYPWKLKVAEVHFCGGKANNAGADSVPAAAATPDAEGFTELSAEDELPF